MTSVQVKGDPRNKPGSGRSSRSAQGRQLSFFHLLEPVDRPPAVASEPVAGLVTLTRREAVAALRISNSKLARLLTADVLEETFDGKYRLLEGSDLCALYKAWLPRFEPRHDWKSVRQFVEVRAICGGKGADLPPKVMAAARAVLQAQHTPGDMRELAALLDIPQALARRLMSRGLGPSIKAASGFKNLEPLTLDEALQIAPGLATATRTCFDRTTYDDYPAPSPPVLQHLGALRGHRLLPAATVFAFQTAAYARRTAPLEGHMLAIVRIAEQMDELFPGGDRLDEVVVANTLDHIHRSKLLDHRFTDNVRDTTCRTWELLRRAIGSWTLGVDPDNSLGLRKLVPPCHPDPALLKERLRQSFGTLRAAARVTRKERSDVLADNLTDISSRVAFRMEQLTDIAQAARGAAATLKEQVGDAIQPFQDFSIPTHALCENGTFAVADLKGARQEEHWRVWRENDFRRSLNPPASKNGELDLGDRHEALRNGPTQDSDRPRERGECRPSSQPLVYERLGATPIIGNVATKPFFVIASDVGGWTAPASNDARLLRKRHALRKQWSLPPARTFGKGLLTFDDPTLWREARRRDRSIVPLPQIEAALLFGSLAWNTVKETLVRGTFLMQMELTDAGFPREPTRQGCGQVYIAAIDKTPAHATAKFVRYPISEDTFNLAMDAADRVMEEFGRTDGTLPDVLIEAPYRWKRPHPRPYIFQWGGRALLRSEVDHLVKLLLSNIMSCLLHDIRHAGAADLYDRCQCGEILKEALGQSSGEWRHYAAPTAKMKRRRAWMFVQRKQRQALALIKATGT